MSPNIKKLFTALSFLKIKSSDLRYYQWKYPIILCAIAHLSYWFLPIKPVIIGDNGIIESANSLLNILIGFYIASLAAVASFPSEILDQKIKGGDRAPKITIKGKNDPEILSRRRFLTILFGYCAFVSILLYAIGQVTSIIAPSLVQTEFFIGWGGNILKIIWLTIYFFFAGSLLITTLLGLHYLIERMHRV